MRVRTGVIFALNLILLAAGGALAAAPISMPIRVDGDQVQVSVAADGWTDIELRSGLEPRAPGEPNLPALVVQVPLPEGQRATGVTFTAGERITIAEGVVPRPMPSDRPSLDGGPIPASPLSAIYEGAAAFPALVAELRGNQVSRGQRLAMVLVSPVVWNASTRRLELITSGTLTVSVGRDDTPASDIARTRRPRVEASELARRGENTAVVYDLRSLVSQNRTPSLDGAPVEYLIITHSTLAQSFEPLAEWQTRSGHPAAIQTMDWIDEHYPEGLDGPDRVRRFIRDAYEFWGTENVLIGGDPSLVPIRYAKSYAYGGTANPNGYDIATDYYYACLDGSWNANGNGIYGEGAGGSVTVHDAADLLPEVNVGRVPASTPSDAAAWWNKYLTYVTTPDLSDYHKNVVLAAEVLFDAGWKPGDCDSCQSCPEAPICARQDGASDCFVLEDSLQAGPRGDFWRFKEFFERHYWWGTRGHPESQPLNNEILVDALNQGGGIFFHMGHGDRDRLAIGVERLESGDLLGLTNSPRVFGLAYTVNCNSAAVDYRCAAEAWLFAPNGAGLSYVGSTNLDFPVAARIFTRRFFHAFPGVGDVPIGEEFYRTEGEFSAIVGISDNTARFLMYSVIFLGDPGMHLWTALPVPITATYPASVAADAGAVSVHAAKGGQALPNARVTLYKAGDFLVSGTTDGVGNVSLPISPEDTGSCLVTVTHADGVPFQGTLNITSATAGYLALTGYLIDDSPNVQNGTNGNGNGQVEVGEVVRISIDYANRSAAAAAGAQAELVLSGEPTGIQVELQDSAEELGAVPGNSTRSSEGAFRIAVTDLSGAAPNHEQDLIAIPVAVRFTAGGSTGDLFALHPDLYARRPDLVLFAGTPVDETDGDQNPENGEDWRWDFDFYNRGAGEPGGLRADLAAVVPSRVTFRVASTPVDLDPQAPDHWVTRNAFSFGINQATGLFFILSVEDTLVSPPRLVFRRRVDLSPPPSITTANATGAPSTIALNWSAVTEPDLWGYRVQRNEGGGSAFFDVGVGYIEGVSYIADEGLPPLTPYTYRVAAVDSSGNASPWSEPLLTSTAPGALEGWPSTLEEDAEKYSAPVIDNLNGFGPNEVLNGGDVLYAFNSDGSDFHDGDGSPSTRGKLFSASSTRENFWGKPALVDVNGDGQVEIAANAVNRSGAPPIPGALILCNNLGEVVWQRVLTNRPVAASPAVGDVDGDGLPEITVLAGNKIYSFHAVDGTPLQAGTDGAILSIPENTGALFSYGSVALANFDSDPALEIVFVTAAATSARLYVVNGKDGSNYGTNLSGFPITWSENQGRADEASNSSPALADIDNDGKPEIAVTTRFAAWLVDPDRPSNRIVWHKQVSLSGSPLNVGNLEPNGSPAFGDVDGDGDLDVAYGWSRGRLYVRDAATGEALDAFKNGLNDWLQLGSEQVENQLGSPLLADLDGDGRPEVIVGARHSGNVYAVRRDGTLVPGFPYTFGGDIVNHLAFWDTNRDGHPELVVTANAVNEVTVLTFPSFNFDGSNADANPWPCFRQNNSNTGFMPSEVIVPVGLQAPLLTADASRAVDIVWNTDLDFAAFALERQEAGETAWMEVLRISADDARVARHEYRGQDAVPHDGTWRYRVLGLPTAGETQISAAGTVLVQSRLDFALHAASPNPFRSTTELALDLPKNGRVSLRVLDASGRLARMVFDGVLEAGPHHFVWDGRDGAARELPPSVYFVEATMTGEARQLRKLVLLP